MTDPFAELGLDAGATAEEVRRARRELAKREHPDVGGDADAMRRLNDAAALALRRIRDRRDDPEPVANARPPDDLTPSEPDGRRFDVPSFTVETLPVETFEALVLAAAALGDVVDDEPPYEMTVEMHEPTPCWCRLHVVPDAGASTVSLAIAPSGRESGADGSGGPPSVETVRDAWIRELNALDWSQL